MAAVDGFRTPGEIISEAGGMDAYLEQGAMRGRADELLDRMRDYLRDKEGREFTMDDYNAGVFLIRELRGEVGRIAKIAAVRLSCAAQSGPAE